MAINVGVLNELAPQVYIALNRWVQTSLVSGRSTIFSNMLFLLKLQVPRSFLLGGRGPFCWAGTAPGKRIAVIIWANEQDYVPRMVREKNPGMRHLALLVTGNIFSPTFDGRNLMIKKSKAKQSQSQPKKANPRNTNRQLFLKLFYAFHTFFLEPHYMFGFVLILFCFLFFFLCYFTFVFSLFSCFSFFVLVQF